MSSKSRFRPNTRRYRLTWPDDHELSGLEVVMRGMRLGELEKLASSAAGLDEASMTDDDKMNLVGALIDRLAKVMVSWNRIDEDTVTDDDDESGEVLPANAEGLRALEIWEFEAILTAYLTHSAGVSAPLDNSSNSGAPSPAGLPMTEL